MFLDTTENLSIFDQDEYFRAYPDVKEAFEHGHISSGYEHYIKYGKNEGRIATKRDILASDLYHHIIKLETELNERRIIENLSIISRRIKKTNSILFYTHKYLEGNIKQTFFKTCEIIKNKNLNIDCSLLTLDQSAFNLATALGYSAILWDGNNGPKIKKIMSTAVVVDEGFLVETAPTPAMLYNLLSSSYRINLWHGTPMRLVGLNEFAVRNKIDYHHSAVFASWSMNNLLCSSSANDKEMFDQMLISDKFEVTGYARNDIFYRDLNHGDMVNVDKTIFELVSNKKSGSKVIYYAPTWRENNSKWVETINLEYISECLHSMGYIFIVNLHPFEFIANLDYLSKIQHLTILQPNSDTYPILKNVDLLITDYSSIIFDFLHTQKPVILFRPNHDSYISHDRAISAERDNCVNAPIIASSQDLVATVTTIFDSFDVNNVIAALNIYHQYHDAMASERCANLIIDSCLHLTQG